MRVKVYTSREEGKRKRGKEKAESGMQVYYIRRIRCLTSTHFAFESSRAVPSPNSSDLVRHQLAAQTIPSARRSDAAEDDDEQHKAGHDPVTTHTSPLAPLSHDFTLTRSK